MTGSISQTIKLIQQKIPSKVKLIAITKQVGIEPMREAYGVGVRDFGENRLQEALDKQQQFEDLTDINWHFIGHIQKNKAKKIVENFEWIHSVDSLVLAKRLNRLAQESNLTPKVFLQVKVLPDPNKYGWEAEELIGDLAELDRYQNLKIKGLMTILPLGLSPEETLSAFEATAKLAAQIQQRGYENLPMKELSMGMSGDYLLAIAAGATMIRLGRTIFGSK
ncbi:YggS family pyridoxal phosphate-dependent enzyme [Waterburya agarophytonicola K14]|uniref:Pyridoxal phosphate homeostasis protein n=1 Tax=Waterburya agarophytonicola KI4 TaxID=2874699 RepID=A0A964BSE8_9CYAN|nr:YggS family pyridoxal phosphate-dependent enzyme [Waterburya agarophytonicola]MCC0177876.1 YggS family pyridoxal phosphate-dependent enzyme [Waterburya agarophytonicola KI4]